MGGRDGLQEIVCRLRHGPENGEQNRHMLGLTTGQNGVHGNVPRPDILAAGTDFHGNDLIGPVLAVRHHSPVALFRRRNHRQSVADTHLIEEVGDGLSVGNVHPIRQLARSKAQKSVLGRRLSVEREFQRCPFIDPLRVQGQSFHDCRNQFIDLIADVLRRAVLVKVDVTKAQPAGAIECRRLGQGGPRGSRDEDAGNAKLLQRDGQDGGGWGDPHVAEGDDRGDRLFLRQSFAKVTQLSRRLAADRLAMVDIAVDAIFAEYIFDSRKHGRVIAVRELGVVEEENGAGSQVVHRHAGRQFQLAPQLPPARVQKWSRRRSRQFIFLAPRFFVHMLGHDKGQPVIISNPVKKDRVVDKNTSPNIRIGRPLIE